MQANEVLGSFDLALKDCTEVLKLDPTNTDAVQAKKRLSDRIAGKSKFFHFLVASNGKVNFSFQIYRFHHPMRTRYPGRNLMHR